jgi:hypothetical protein
VLFGGVAVQGTRVLFDMYMDRRRQRRVALTELHSGLYPRTVDAAARARASLPDWSVWWRDLRAELNAKVLDPWFREWNLSIPIAKGPRRCGESSERRPSRSFGARTSLVSNRSSNLS